MAEMYVMQRYMQLDTLREYGVDEFDAWAATFGSIETKIELAPNGRTMQEVTGFRSFVNIPELVALYAKFADVQTAEMLNLPRPKRKGGTITVVEAEPNAEEEAYIASLVQRAEDMKGKRVEKGGDNMLKVVSEGRKVATDFRLIDPANPVNPEGKAAKLVANVLRIYKAGKHPGLAQMIFLDMGTPFKAKARPTVAVDEDVETTMSEDEGDGPNLDESEALASKFNLYEDLRERLVKQGIPKKEIAFIHEASNDLQKAALFRKVRSGEVRVLIGSTAKMGVGTNVQRVLVAMHHMDAPWKPAEVEQRDGRIERQGNLNPEIEILRYVTKRSFDSFMWQTLERKARFIGQIKAGARGIRTAEDIDDPLPEAATLKAAAAGDPRIMEHAELTKEVRDLEMQARNHERDIQRARVSIDYERVRVGEDRERQRKLDADVAALKDTKGDKFAMSLIRGGDFTDRTKAGEAVKDFMVRSGAAVWSGTPTVWKLGSVGGLNMGASVLRSSDGVEVSTFLEGEARYFSGRPFLLTDDVDPLGLIRRFEAPLRDIPGMAAEMPGVIKQRQESIARLEKQAESKPFPKRERLIETKRRLIELEAALKPKDPNKTPEAGEGGTVMAMADSPNGWGTVEGGSTFAMDVREGDRVIPLGKDITDTKIDVIAPRNPERAEAIRAAIQEGLEAIGVGDIKTVVVEEIGMSRADGNNHRAHGFMWGDVLAIAMTSQEGRGLSWTVSHEALHAISKLGVLSKSEWKLLIDKSNARLDGPLRHRRPLPRPPGNGEDRGGHRRSVRRARQRHAHRDRPDRAPVRQDPPLPGGGQERPRRARLQDRRRRLRGDPVRRGRRPPAAQRHRAIRALHGRRRGGHGQPLWRGHVPARRRRWPGPAGDDPELPPARPASRSSHPGAVRLVRGHRCAGPLEPRPTAACRRHPHPHRVTARPQRPLRLDERHHRERPPRPHRSLRPAAGLRRSRPRHGPRQAPRLAAGGRDPGAPVGEPGRRPRGARVAGHPDRRGGRRHRHAGPRRADPQRHRRARRRDGRAGADLAGQLRAQPRLVSAPRLPEARVRGQRARIAGSAAS